jgi:hypothetical protein
MKISLNMFRASVVACVALLANAAFAAPTSSLTIDFNEVGSDVVATVAGSFDISSLIPQSSGTMTMRNFVSPNDGLAGFSDSGSPVAWVSWRIDEQAAYTQPFWGDGSNAGNGSPRRRRAVAPSISKATRSAPLRRARRGFASLPHTPAKR